MFYRNAYCLCLRSIVMFIVQLSFLNVKACMLSARLVYMVCFKNINVEIYLVEYHMCCVIISLYISMFIYAYMYICIYGFKRKINNN